MASGAGLDSREALVLGDGMGWGGDKDTLDAEHRLGGERVRHLRSIREGCLGEEACELSRERCTEFGWLSRRNGRRESMETGG